MLAKRLSTIMPPMSFEEAQETTKIPSICDFLASKHFFINIRPFRSPHHLRRGPPRLAHNGVLFMDKLPKFKRSTLEVLRQPLEDSWLL